MRKTPVPPSRAERRRIAPAASAQAFAVMLAAASAAGCLAPAYPPGPTERAHATVKGELWRDAERVLVTVNGRDIRKGDLYRRVVDKLGPRTLLEEVIAEELFTQEAERRGIDISDEDVARATDRYLEGMAQEVGGMESLRARYAARGIPVDELRRDMAAPIRTELLRREVIKSMRVIDDEALRRYYDQTYKRKRYVTRQVVYSFMPGPDGSDSDLGARKYRALRKAQRAAEKVRQGHDFAEIARFESDDSLTARLGGAIGALSEEAPLPAVFKEAIFALEEGEVSDPVENPQAMGFHVFQVTAILPSESFVDCVDRMKQELREREPTPEEIGSALESLRSGAEIRYLPAAVGTAGRSHEGDTTAGATSGGRSGEGG